jgi:hypothetical protein
MQEMPRDIHIAIIDDGISAKDLGIRLDYDIEIEKGLQVTARTVNRRRISRISRISHGTLCAAIIHKYNPQVKISSIKILNDYLKGEPAQLYAALRWCVLHKIDIVNVSLGSTDLKDKKQVREIINQAAAAGVIVVCACHNEGYITYPAALSSVVSVKCDTNQQLSEHDFVVNYYSDDGIDVIAFAQHRLEIPVYGTITCSNSNSYASPFMAAYISRILSDMPANSIDDVKLQLLKHAANNNILGSQELRSESPDWITGAFIFLKSHSSLSRGKYYFALFHNIFRCDDQTIDTHVAEKLASSEKLGFNTIIIDDIPMNAEIFNTIYQIAAEFRLNVIYLGESSFDVPYIVQSNPVKVWHWSCKRKIIEYNEYSFTPLDIPLIVIFTSGKIDVFHLLNGLKMLFSDERYECFAFTEKPAANLFDVEYLPVWSMNHHAEDTAGYLSSYLKRTHSDLCVGAFELDSYLGVDKFIRILESDIEIHLHAENETIRLISYTGKQEEHELFTATVEAENIEDVAAAFLFKYLREVLT